MFQNYVSLNLSLFGDFMINEIHFSYNLEYSKLRDFTSAFGPENKPLSECVQLKMRGNTKILLFQKDKEN